MISRQKHNEEMRKARRKRAQHIRDKYLEYSIRSYVDTEPVHRELGDEERMAIRDRAKNEFQKSRRLSIIAFLIATLVLASIGYLILIRN